MILKTRINTTSLLATLLFILICITIQIINIKAGYGEVWQEMNWVCSMNTILSTTTTAALTNNPRHQPPTQRSIITKNIS